MEVDYIIAGQGICGSFLSYYLQEEGASVMVIDEPVPFSSTKVASGVINPVTGRRVVATWMIETLLPFVWKAYTTIGNRIGSTIIEEKPMVTFPPSLQMKETYEKRMHETGTYIAAGAGDAYKTWFNYIFGCYQVEPTYLINLHPLLRGWRKELARNNHLLEEQLDSSMLDLHTSHVTYKNIKARKIIYCNGVNAFESVAWKNLPYVYNKGQVAIADIPALPKANIYKYGALSLVPWYDGLWWVGSSYENNFYTIDPTPGFLESTQRQLSAVLNTPFTIVDHMAALRPAALERRPFVGIHPHLPVVAILNGMGTKGCSLAPYFGSQLAMHLLHDTPLDPLADIKRFSRILKQE